MNEEQRAAFEEWCKERFGQIPLWVEEDSQYLLSSVQLRFEAYQAALTSPEARVTQYMAECMVMVRDELIEAGVISDKVAPMFVANAVLGHVMELRDALEYMLESCHAHDDSGENAQATARAALAAMEKQK